MPQQTPASNQTAMIIAAGLVGGVVTFAIVATTMAPPAPKEPDVVSLVMAGVGAFTFLASFIIPGLISGAMLQQLQQKGTAGDEQQLLQVYQTRMIMRLAMLEGGAFANLVAYMTQGQQWSLIIVAWLVATMLMFFPTPGRINNWIQQRKELLQFENDTARS
ncbi:hypothetical protein GYB59_08155 [bacterium]|uniref:Uncharacterized protein n=2 Tax=Rubinisphaera brasiliensis TaxID=119 RepID=F0SGP9_RUBBR|nr:hypothetical protein Plabr_4077 [Rubinisphaera brasiliensis DSM 5305]MBR9801660.1 hypothetical protein [bacterium]